jgi:tetratricopeptide (TPR) repeat protein
MREYHKQEPKSMRYLHGTTKGRSLLVVSRFDRTSWTALLVIVMAVIVPVSWVQGQESLSKPMDRDALIAAADSARDAGRFSEAIRLYSHAEKAFGSDPRLFRGRGMAREMLNEDSRAIDDFKLAVKADTSDYESMEHMAGMYERGGTHIKEAIELYKRALDLDPRPHMKGNMAAWIAMLESRLRPDDARAVGCWHLGNEKIQKGDSTSAASLYSRAIELNPHFYQAYFSRGLVHFEAGDAGAALADFEQTVRMAPNFAQALLQRGLTREQLGNRTGAREDFARAAKMDPRDPAALYHCARTLEADDDQETALRLYRDALRFRPSPELAAAIREKASALLGSPRIRRVRNSAGSPEPGSLW